MMRKTTWCGLAAWLAISGRCAAQGDDAALVARGTEVYQAQRCATCHAVAGKGNRRYPLDGVGGRLAPDVIRKWIVAPKEMDPKVRKRAYDKLPPEQLDALVAYLMSLKQP